MCRSSTASAWPRPASGRPWAASAIPEPALGLDPRDNALAETVIGLYKTEVIHRRGPWRSVEAVEIATLEWGDWFNNKIGRASWRERVCHDVSIQVVAVSYKKKTKRK